VWGGRPCPAHAGGNESSRVPPRHGGQPGAHKGDLSDPHSTCNYQNFFQRSILLAWRPVHEACHGEGIRLSDGRSKNAGFGLCWTGNACPRHDSLGSSTPPFLCAFSNFTEACSTGAVRSWQTLLRENHERLLLTDIESVSTAPSALCQGIKSCLFSSNVCQERPSAVSLFGIPACSVSRVRWSGSVRRLLRQGGSANS
jgi:hypothetical protein